MFWPFKFKFDLWFKCESESAHISVQKLYLHPPLQKNFFYTLPPEKNVSDPETLPLSIVPSTKLALGLLNYKVTIGNII